MNKEKNKENVLPIVLMVQDANEEIIQAATKTLNNFYNACYRLEGYADIYINVLVCSTKCEWLTKGYENIETAPKHECKTATNKVDIKEMVSVLKSRLLTFPGYYEPLVFFFLTNEFERTSFAYINDLGNLYCPKIIVNLLDSEDNSLFIRLLKNCSHRTRVLVNNGDDGVSLFNFLHLIKFHMLSEEGKEKGKELEKVKAKVRYTLSPNQTNEKPASTPMLTDTITDNDISWSLLNFSRETSGEYVPAPRGAPTNNGLINYSLLCENEIKRNSNFTIDFVTFTDEYRYIVDKVKESYKSPSTKSGAINNVAENSEITLRLFSPNIASIHDEQSFIWDGKFNITTLSGFVDKHYDGDNLLLVVDIIINGIKITTVKTTVDLLKSTLGKLDFFKEDVRRVFFSYSSKDRKTVLQIVKKTIGVTGDSIDFFLDVLKLRAGDNWQERIYQEIDNSDTFCLLWSYSAYRSKWVKKEWEYALNKKGLGVFNPININNEKEHHVPIPRKLSSIHFANYNVLIKNK